MYSRSRSSSAAVDAAFGDRGAGRVERGVEAGLLVGEGHRAAPPSASAGAALAVEFEEHDGGGHGDVQRFGGRCIGMVTISSRPVGERRVDAAGLVADDERDRGGRVEGGDRVARRGRGADGAAPRRGAASRAASVAWSCSTMGRPRSAPAEARTALGL